MTHLRYERKATRITQIEDEVNGLGRILNKVGKKQIFFGPKKCRKCQKCRKYMGLMALAPATSEV